MMLVLLVLCSGFFQCTLANRLRIFHPNESFEVDNERPFRKDALQYCKDRNMSLVTLYDGGDANFTLDVIKGCHFWLGLYQYQNNTSSWSNKETVTFNLSNVIQLDDDQKCGAFQNDSWINMDCSERLAFMCYNGNSSSNNYTLIEEEKTWCQARHFCKRHYTDLVSISSDGQNTDVRNKGRHRIFWIGLLHDRWKWEDNGCSTYRKWKNRTEVDIPGTLTALGYGSNEIMKVHDSAQCTICSKGKVRIIRRHPPSTWEKAFDYCNKNHTGLLWIQDQEDQKAVQQWLEHPPSDEHFWIGLRQSRVFGFWIWMSNRMVSYSNWENDTQPKQPLSYQCGAISGQTFRWTDENCQRKLPFLCEEEISFMNP